MRAVVQRVRSASVTVGGEEVGAIGHGLTVLLGVAREDAESDAEYMAGKVADLRIFQDDEGKMNLSVSDTGGEVLVVSQFTLLADCRKGRRPSFIGAGDPNDAERLYERFVACLRGKGVGVATGRFQASMDVQLVNAGPVTILLDSKKLF